MSRRVSEILTGFVVILVAAFFLAFALTRAKAVGNGGGYLLHAQFGHIGALGVGQAVKIGGVSVGHVTATALDPETYAAVVTFSIDQGIKIPQDSSAAIVSASLLGGDYLSISPGGSNTMLKPGQAINVTQSAINIESLLGKFIFSAANVAGSMGKPSQGGNGGSSGGGTNPLSKGMPSIGGAGAKPAAQPAQ